MVIRRRTFDISIKKQFSVSLSERMGGFRFKPTAGIKHSIVHLTEQRLHLLRPLLFILLPCPLLLLLLRFNLSSKIETATNITPIAALNAGDSPFSLSSISRAALMDRLISALLMGEW